MTGPSAFAGTSVEGKVAVVVSCTARIEGSSAVRARMIGLDVGVGAQRLATGPAQHGWLVAPLGGPRMGLVVGDRLVAAEAGVEYLTARKANGNYVPRPVVVGAAGRRIHLEASQGHGKAVIRGRGTARL